MITGIAAVNALVNTFIMPPLKAVLEKYDMQITRFGTLNDCGEGNFSIDIGLNMSMALYSGKTIWVEEIKSDILYTLIDMGFDTRNIDIDVKFTCHIAFKNFEFHKKMLNYVQ